MSAANCAREVAWYDPIWRLLLKPKREDRDGSSGLVEDLLKTVLNVVFLILWFGIEGYDNEAWKVGVLNITLCVGITGYV